MGSNFTKYLWLPNAVLIAWYLSWPLNSRNYLIGGNSTNIKEREIRTNTKTINSIICGNSRTEKLREQTREKQRGSQSLSFIVVWLKKAGLGSSLAVRTQLFHCRGPGSIPGQVTKILRAARCSQKKKEKKESRYDIVKRRNKFLMSSNDSRKRL